MVARKCLFCPGLQTKLVARGVKVQEKFSFLEMAFRATAPNLVRCGLRGLFKRFPIDRRDEFGDQGRVGGFKMDLDTSLTGSGRCGG